MTTVNGLALQFFDEVRDAEEDGGHPESKESVGTKALQVGKFVGGNLALGAVTALPGFAIGISRKVAAKASDAYHDGKANSTGVTCTITAVRVSGLPLIEARAVGRMSPYVEAALVMEGVEPGRAQTCRTAARHNGGNEFTFEEGKHVGVLGIPSDDPASANASLLIRVMDEPEFGLVGAVRAGVGCDFTIGSAALSLAQLFPKLEEHDHVGSVVNLNLVRGADFQEPAGLLRLQVELATKDTAETAEPVTNSDDA
jgi:hypothetical protein